MKVNVRIMYSLLVILAATVLPSFEAIKCHHSLRNSVSNHTFDNCQGDICYLLKDADNGVLIQGCVQGIPYLSEGFQQLDTKWAWLCASDLCNAKRPSAAIVATASPATSACLANASSGANCRASKCWYQREKWLVQPGTDADMYAHINGENFASLLYITAHKNQISFQRCILK